MEFSFDKGYFENAIAKRYPNNKIEVISYDAHVTWFNASNLRSGIHMSTKPSNYYVKVTTHVVVDGNDVYTTTGDGIFGGIDSAINHIFKTIDQFISKSSNEKLINN